MASALAFLSYIAAATGALPTYLALCPRSDGNAQLRATGTQRPPSCPR
jgi:hypothetical protein